MDSVTYNKSLQINDLSKEQFLEVIVNFILRRMKMAEGAKYEGHWYFYKDKTFLEIYRNTIKDINLEDRHRTLWMISSRLKLDFEMTNFLS